MTQARTAGRKEGKKLQWRSHCFRSGTLPQLARPPSAQIKTSTHPFNQVKAIMESVCHCYEAKS